MLDNVRKHGLFVFALVLILGIGFSITEFNNKPTGIALKEYKDGIQNHLTWSIKGECFFVRPNDDVTVYLVRVPDCDRK